MPISNASTSRLKAACSVSQMAALVGLSRARFYNLVDRGVFLPPVYSLVTRKPFFLREMQQRNLDVRRDQLGVNGEYILFYEPRETTAPRRRAAAPAPPHLDLARRLLPQLATLGIGTATAEAVGQAIAASYPEGVGETPDSEVLRTIYRRLRRQQDA